MHYTAWTSCTILSKISFLKINKLTKKAAVWSTKEEGSQWCRRRPSKHLVFFSVSKGFFRDLSGSYLLWRICSLICKRNRFRLPLYLSLWANLLDSRKRVRSLSLRWTCFLNCSWSNGLSSCPGMLRSKDWRSEVVVQFVILLLCCPRKNDPARCNAEREGIFLPNAN